MIDVLLPFYGDPSLLRMTVESVRSQTRSDWRLVVVDDGYPDDSVAAWFSELADERIEYRRNAVRLGANRNYVHALSLARADHVVVMGADDLLEPTFLEVVEDGLAAHPDVQVVQCGVRVINGDNRPVEPLGDRIKRWLRPRVQQPTVLAGDTLIASLLHGNWTYFPSLCWHRATIARIGFRPDFHVVQDLALLIDVLREDGSMLLLPEVAFAYRRHAGSDSAVKTLTGDRFDEERRYFATIGDELSASRFPRARRAARWRVTSRLHAASLLPVALRGGDLQQAKGLLGRALG